MTKKEQQKVIKAIQKYKWGWYRPEQDSNIEFNLHYLLDCVKQVMKVEEEEPNNNKKILDGIKRWCKAMISTGHIKKMKGVSTKGWYDEQELESSILSYIEKEGVDLWKEAYQEQPEEQDGYCPVCDARSLSEEDQRSIKQLPPDKTIIKDCLGYVAHKIKKHPNSFASRNWESWLPRIDELRKPDTFCGMLVSDKFYVKEIKKGQLCPKCKKQYAELLFRKRCGSDKGNDCYSGKCPHCATIIVETEIEEKQQPKNSNSLTEKEIKWLRFNIKTHRESKQSKKIKRLIRDNESDVGFQKDIVILGEKLNELIDAHNNPSGE